MWDIILVAVGFLLGVVGWLGSFVPVLPGPPLTCLGLLLIHWSRYADYSTDFLVLFLVLTVAVTVIDNVLPVWMTKRYGGSRYAVWGSFFGLLAGMFFPPWGLLIGSFAGAFIGELLFDSRNTTRALKVAWGSFAAFLFGTGAKMALSSVMIYYMIRPLFS
jgi:uncharacterized protein YqgC (DUF456 family)